MQGPNRVKLAQLDCSRGGNVAGQPLDKLWALSLSKRPCYHGCYLTYFAQVSLSVMVRLKINLEPGAESKESLSSEK